MAGRWMPRKGMNNHDESNQLRRLTGTLSPRFSAGYGPLLSNLSGAPPGPKKIAPDLAATGSSAAHTIAAEMQVQSTRKGGVAQ